MSAKGWSLWMAVGLLCHATALWPAHAAPVERTPTAASSAAEDAKSQRITVERSYRGQVATGAIVLCLPPQPEEGPSPHAKLAGSRAWLALAEKRAEQEDWAGAVACARAGLTELGIDSRSAASAERPSQPTGADDSLAAGRARSGALLLVRTLRIRTEYYRQVYADAIAE